MKQRNNFTISTFCLSLVATTQASATVIINELDYDQPGADTAEFIELYNAGDTSVSLDSYSISLINGNDTSAYRTIDLAGFSIEAGEYFVVCNDALLVANCDYDFTDQTGWIQNGAPDAVALFDDIFMMDSVAYEGDLPPFTEGSPLLLGDSGSETASLARIDNGIDTNDNGQDFGIGCITPGSANVAGTGDCSAPNVVPLPASIWLLGSGLAGLISVARRKS